MSKKNCHTCKHLDWVEDGILDGDDGFVCIKRHANADGAEASALNAKLDSEAYRNRYKRCFEPVLGAANTNKGGEAK